MMKRAELLQAIASLPILGALAVGERREVAQAVLREQPKGVTLHERGAVSDTDKWLIVHAGDPKADVLPWYHRVGQSCRICSVTGVPAIAFSYPKTA